ncbi:MAG: AEC family transporter [Anaerotruncus sp.]|nr:AEC family transporter [Anaerotruncus sp.]
MEQFFRMAEIQSVLFLYMLIGWICRKTDLVKAAAQPSFTNFLLYVSIPCMVFQSFDMEFTMETLYRGASVLTIATISALVSLMFGRYAYNWCNPREKCIMKYGTLVSNSGFAGLPVIQDAYGQDGLFLGSLFIIPNRIMMWSAGISLFTDAPLKQRIKNVMLNPGIIAVELGVLRMLFQPAIPQQLNKALSALGAMSTPLGMVIIGMILSGVSPRTVLDKKAFILVAVRQFLFPLGTLAILRLLGTDLLTLQISVVLTGMPVGSSTAFLADKYGADAVFASKCVFISTLTSLITIPILTIFF